MKRTGILLLTLTFLLCLSNTAIANIEVIIDEREYLFNPSPVVQENRTLVPMRAFFEALGATVDWNERTQTAVGTRGDIKVHIPVGNVYPKINGRIEPIQVAAQIVDGSTYIPLRFASTALGDEVRWDDTSNTITITTKQKTQTKQLIPIDVPGIGTFNSYRFAENIYVGPNLNLELLYIAAAAGSKFTHPGYGNSSNHLSRAVSMYFRRFNWNNHYATEIYDLSYKTTVSSLNYLSSSISHDILRLGNLHFEDSDKYVISESNTYFDFDVIVNNLRGFYSVTKADSFFKENRTLYNDMVDDFTRDVTFNHVQRMEEFYGTDMSNYRFQVILSPIINGGVASSMESPDGNITYLNIMNPLLETAVFYDVLYHETCHNFFSSIRKDNYELIEQYSSYADVLKDNATIDNRLFFDHFVDETITRAVTLYMLEKYHGKQMAAENLQKVLDRGWTSTDDIYYLIKNKYANNRGQYPTFESFLPVILEMLKAKSTGQPYDVGARDEFLPKNLVIIGSDLTYLLTLKHIWPLKVFLRANEQDFIDPDIFHNALVIIAYYPGQQVISGNYEDLLGYSYGEIITATEQGKEYFNIVETSDRTVFVFGAKDYRALNSLMYGFEFESYWYQ